VAKNLSLPARFRSALLEDGAFSDATTAALGLSRAPVIARFLCKGRGVFAGGAVIAPILKLVDRSARVRLRVKDGADVRPGLVLAEIRAREAGLLAAERLILNLLCHLSGVATLTRRYVRAVRGTPAAILDTRKTTPLWRDLEKAAVVAGGGQNHRFSLADAVLVKDNHWRLLDARKLSPAAVYGPGSRARRGMKFLAIEATDRRQVWEAIKARADIILLDNMPADRIKESVIFIRAARVATGTTAPLIEVSGGITPDKARRLARLGIDRISVGALTHSAPALDISLEVD
jgi:nicotinate-nucleotide pyrophosphorylase (carboxylating)